MKVLIIGRGGREHALAWKVSQSKRATEVFVAPGNDGMHAVATCVPINENDHNALVEFAKREEISLTIVGPESPLLAGIVDLFQQEGLPIFGPTKAAAEIEGSKSFAKHLMKKYNIPTAAYETFSDVDEAKAYVMEKGTPLVIKADGIAAGKGVVIANSITEAMHSIEEMMVEKKFGTASSKIVIEEYLEGEEFSFLALVNGTSIIPLSLSQDHKRAYDGDQGPNTGGMGAYSPVPQISHTVQKSVMEKVIAPITEALVQEGKAFSGILYAGMILTTDGAKVIEFNARFGDPEAQVVLPRIETDFLDLVESVLHNEPITIKWSDAFCVGVVLASKGYPGTCAKGKLLGDMSLFSTDSLLFHAGTKWKEAGYVTDGGRLLLLAALGKTLEEAHEKVYYEMEKFQCEHVFYRKDIASKALHIVNKI
jgi:phosphoribosylamine---glycine ligase